MSATPTLPPEGTHAPSPVEFLWERYRSLILTVVAATFVALGGNYAFKYWRQKGIDQQWSAFAASIGAEKSYTDPKAAADSLTEALGGVDLAKLESALATASDGQKPFLLLAVARKATLDKNWDRAEQALSQLETTYPNHSLVRKSDYPIQVREEVKKDKPDSDADAGRDKKPEYKPAKSGSAVSLLRDEIAAAKAYAAPKQFEPVAPPADAKKVKIEFSGGYGSITIALMPQAPKHTEAFLKLAAEGFWKDLNVDEIQRPGTGFAAGQPRQMHLGFLTTKDPDSTKWTTTEPSKNIVDFETNELSHFAGAVAARNEADGKSCADRFYIVADDASRFDGDRVVFGYVVEGLENVKKICEAALTAQDEEAGRGKPTERITVVSVTVL